MAILFVSYRRQDSEDITSRICDRLRTYFGPSSVFVDVESIPGGADFRSHLNKHIEQCDAIVPIIGNEWSHAANREGNRRLDDPEDFVRLEIALAIEQGKTILPVLVHGAQMPKPEEIPDDIQQMAYRQAIDVRSGAPFHTDLGRLIEAIEQQAGLQRATHRFPLHFVFIPIGIISCFVGFMISLGTMVALHNDLQIDTYAASKTVMRTWAFWGLIPITIGLASVVFGKWWCCGIQTEARRLDHFRHGVGEAPVRKSHKASLSLCFGLLASAWNVLAALPAIVLAIWAVSDIRRRSGWIRGTGTAIAGIIFAVLGVIISSLFLWVCWRAGEGVRLQESAVTHLIANEPDQALLDIKRARRLRPMSIGLPLKFRGIAHLQRGDARAAISDLSDAIAMLPNQGPLTSITAEAHYFRSLGYAQLENHDAAQNDLSIARTLDAMVVMRLQEQGSMAPLPPQDLHPGTYYNQDSFNAPRHDVAPKIQ